MAAVMSSAAERRSGLDRVVETARRHPVALDAALAVLVAAISISIATDGHVPRADVPAGVVCAVLFAVPVVWRRRHALPAAVATAVAAVVCQVVVPAVGDVLALPVLVVGYSVVVHGPRWAGPATAAVLVLGAVLPVALRVGTGGAGAAGVLAVVGALVGAVVWLLGALRRAQLRAVDQLRERARLLEQGRRREVRLELLAERSRISREVHDVVGHSLSGIIAQADGGRFAAHDDPGRAVEVLAAISDAGRAALGDIRGLLGSLRDDLDAPEDGAGPPTIDDVAVLVEQVRSGGLPVVLDVVGAARPLPPGTGLAVYRVVQEGLTNVVKHTGVGTPTTVSLAWRPDELTVEVRDDGPRTARPTTRRDAGYGLVGLRERAALCGGTLDAAPRPGGGFRVRLRVPLAARDRARAGTPVVS